MSGLIRWLPNLAKGSADDMSRFGPNYRRVRTLLDFIPMLSEDAAKISDNVVNALDGPPSPDLDNVAEGLKMARSMATMGLVRSGWRGVPGTVIDAGTASAILLPGAERPASLAALGEAALNVINPVDYPHLADPRIYQTLVSPLASGRAFDLLRQRSPENFLDVVRSLGERNLVARPVDVLTASRFARTPESEREALMEVINAIAGETGYVDTSFKSLADLIAAARRLE